MKQTNCTQCDQPIKPPASGRFCSRRCARAFYENNPAKPAKLSAMLDSDHAQAFRLISAGYLPPARLACPLDSRPLFDLEGVAKIVGVDQGELMEILTSKPPRFDKEIRLG